MQFRVLGPVRMVPGDSAAAGPDLTPRLRTVLAVLLWQANRAVPVDELADLVWDGAPPAGVTEALRALVMRLRRELKEQAAARIITRAPGYAIEVASGELDASQFQTLTQRADAAIRAGQWAEASRTAAEALGLWRDTPLADVPSQLLRDQWVPQLEQLHLQALACRIEADLHQGRHERLVSELQELTARYPLREHFHAQLLVALAGTGRRAEALAAYQEARRVLTAELGIDPGPELRRLHERILTGDASLVVAPAAGDAPGEARARATAGFRQLPASVRLFVGRQTEVSRLGDLMRQALGTPGAAGTVVISAIDGMAGVGKTALAVHAAHRLAGEFPDGQLFLDLHGYAQGHEPRSAGEALEVILRVLGVPAQQVPPGADERAAMFRQRLAGTRTLIVLDNAVSEAQVRPLVPGSAGCLVLVTSRRRLKGLDEALILTLDVLPRADALRLFRAVAGSGRLPPDDPVLLEIVELCGRLPLALRIAAALLRHRPAWTLEHLAGLLRAQETRISALSDGERDLGAIFDMSYRSLPAAGQLMFRCLGLIPGPDFDPAAAAALAAADPPTGERLLEDLVDHNLVIQLGPGRYRLHDLIRLHARALSDRDPVAARDAALGRLMGYYQDTAGQADAAISRFPRPAPARPVPGLADGRPDADAGRKWLRAERPNLLAALRHAASHAQYQRAIALTAVMATVLRSDGPWPEALALHADAIAMARHLGDRGAEADALIQTGVIWGLTGDHPSAIADLEHARHLYQELGDPLGQANALAQLGDARIADDYPGAVRDLEQALRLYEQLANPLGQANALARLGDVRRHSGDYPGAIPALEQALELYQQLGDRIGQGNVLLSLGNSRRHTGDLLGAVQYLEEAVRLYQHLDHQLGQANTLSHLGELQLLRGDYPGATVHLEQAIRIFQDLGSQLGEANVLVLLGCARQSAGDLPGAVELLQAALDMFRRIGNRANQPGALNLYAAMISAAGDHAHAENLYLEALHLARDTHQSDEEAVALEGRAECELRRGETGLAVAHLRQALKVFERLAMSPSADRLRTRLASLAAI
jgi:DNA-binding SARP family transcriptional activator